MGLIDSFRFQNTKPNLTKAIQFAGEKLFDTGIEKRQYMKEVVIFIITGYQNITQRVEQVVGYMKMRGCFSLSVMNSASSF